MKYMVAYRQGKVWQVERQLNNEQLDKFCEELRQKGISFDVGQHLNSSRQAKSRQPTGDEAVRLELDIMPPRGNPCIVRMRRFMSELA